MNSIPAQLEQLIQLVREAQTGDQLALFCWHCQEALYLFVSDELAGQDVDILYPQIADHLDYCTFCLQEYDELANVTATAILGEDIR